MHNLLKLKIMLKNSLMSPDIEFNMHHSHKFLIDIDNTNSEESSGEEGSKSSEDDSE